MKLKQISRRFFSVFDAFPITFGALILVVLFVFTYSYLNNNYSMSEDSAQAVFAAIAKYFLLIFAAVVFLGFLSCLIVCIVFYIRLKHKEKYLKISLDFDNSEKHNITSIAKIEAKKLLFPLFGSVKIRFIFENNFVTKKYILTSKRFRLVSTKNFTAECALNFHDVNNYVLKSAKFYFEDYFSLFSFSCSSEANSQFYVLPSQKHNVKILPNPTTQRDTQIRTDIMRHLPGEFLRFKDFENSDDVRRIVWKIFAKNKELVVRTQELRSNYASKIRLYASFFNNKDLLLQTDNFSRLLLTYYKNAVWSIFSTITNEKKIEIQLKLDTDINVNSENDLLPKQMFEISAAEWQNSLTPADFYEPGNVSALCISSLAEASEMKKILDIKNKSVAIIFVQLSKTFKTNILKLIFRNIFLKPQSGSAEELQLRFLLSPIRKRLIANEKTIIELLNKEDDNFHII